MTYKEFKDYVESKGVTDTTILAYRDMNFGGIDNLLREDHLEVEKGILLIDCPYWESVED